MLSEKYRPKAWTDFVGQPIIDEIAAASREPERCQYGGERWLFESGRIAGCGKTSAALVAASTLGIDPFNVERIDSRAVTIAEFRELSDGMYYHGWGKSGRRVYIVDEIQHLNPACIRCMLGWLESLPKHVLVLGTTTSVTWADDVDGLYSRWRRFRCRKPNAPAVAEHLERIARAESMPIPPGENKGVGSRFLTDGAVPVVGGECPDNRESRRGGLIYPVLNRAAGLADELR